MDDPYENGEGSEVWTTVELSGQTSIPSPVPHYYQRISPPSRGSSRSGTPTEPESPRLGSSPRTPKRRSIYVLPPLSLKKWLRDQTWAPADEQEGRMSEKEFEALFVIRRSDWIFQFSEVPADSPATAKMIKSMASAYNLATDSQLLMIYMSDLRSPVVKIEGCRVAEDRTTIGVRASLLRYIILGLSYKGIRVQGNSDDALAHCISRVECAPKCKTMINERPSTDIASAWISFVLEPIKNADTVNLKVLAHAIC